MNTIRLGLLFLRGAGRRGFIRGGLIAIGTAIGVVSLLVALAYPSLLQTRQERAESRTPRSTSERFASGWYFMSQLRFGSRPFNVTFLAIDEESSLSLPPGLDRLPRPGEALVAPEVRNILARQSYLRGSFPYHVVGEVSPSGLVAPDELFAYVGASRADLPDVALPLGGFGRDTNPEVDIAAGDLKIIQLALLGLVGIPLVVYFAVCARLSSAARDRRLAALRLLGMTIKETQRVNAFESVVAAAVGTLLGLAVFNAIQGALASSGVGGIVWFSQDSNPSLTLVLLCALGLPVLSGIFSVVGSREAVTRALAVRRRAPRRPPRLWRLLPLLAGLGILTGLVAKGTFGSSVSLGDSGGMLLLTGLFLTAVGLAYGFGLVPITLARRVAARTSRLSVNLGLRRLEFEPSGPIRVVSGLVLVVFGMGFANGLQRDAQAANSRLGAVEHYGVQAIEMPPESREDLDSLDGVQAVIVNLQSITTSPPPGSEAPPVSSMPVNASWASCADLAFFLDTQLEGCEEGVAYRVLPETGPHLVPPLRPGHAIEFPLEVRRVEGGSTFKVEVPRETLRLPASDILRLRHIGLLLPPDQLPAGRIPESASIEFASGPDSETIDRVTAGVARISPTATISFLNDNPDARRQSEVVQQLLNLALAIGVIVGVAAFLVTALDQMVERRENLVALSVVGVPSHTLRVAQAVQVGLPLALGTLVAVIAGKLAEQATVLGGGYVRSWAWEGTLIALIVGLLTTSLALLITAASVSARVDVSLIRRE